MQLQAVRAALEVADAAGAPRNARPHRPRIRRAHRPRERAPDARRRRAGAAALQELEARLREQLGPGTEVRVGARSRPAVRPRRGRRRRATGSAFRCRRGRRSPDEPVARASSGASSLAALLLVAAFAFARYLARPLRELDARGRARRPRRDRRRRCRKAGPSEIATLNRGVNAMTANLRQLEHDRALLLAGVSHDLRTPLARLRLGIEMAARDEATRAGMVADIEEMDRIIGQFLEFARTDERRGARAARRQRDRRRLRRALRARRARRALCAGRVPPVPLRPTAYLAARREPHRQRARLRRAAGRGDDDGRRTARSCSTSPIAARASPPDEVERLKQPFTRASAARANAGGVAGRGPRARDRRSHRAPARRHVRSPAARRRRHDRARDAACAGSRRR